MLSSCFLKIYLNSKSFPHAVITEESDEIANAGIGRLKESFLNLISNSVDKCDACASLPPLPKRITFPFLRAVSYILAAMILA